MLKSLALQRKECRLYSGCMLNSTYYKQVANIKATYFKYSRHYNKTRYDMVRLQFSLDMFLVTPCRRKWTKLEKQNKHQQRHIILQKRKNSKKENLQS